MVNKMNLPNKIVRNILGDKVSKNEEETREERTLRKVKQKYSGASDRAIREGVKSSLKRQRHNIISEFSEDNYDE